MKAPLLEVTNLTKTFAAHPFSFGKAAEVRAVDEVSFTIAKGETLALVGESGSGKSTVGRAIMRLCDFNAGSITLDGQRIDTLSAGDLRPLRRRIQAVFQDTSGSLNPRMRVGDILAEPIRSFQLAESEREVEGLVASLLERVRLPRAAAHRRPHEFSGGQRQRIAIARALAAQPDLIICDEAVSALDASVKAQIVNLLAQLQDEMGLSLLFISHDLAIVEHVAHRVAVMYLGKIVEMGPTTEVFEAPNHPYTRALLSAVPCLGSAGSRRRIILKGEPQGARGRLAGCAFHMRCPKVSERCRQVTPTLRRVAGGRLVSCHLADLEAYQSDQLACAET